MDNGHNSESGLGENGRWQPIRWYESLLRAHVKFWNLHSRGDTMFTKVKKRMNLCRRWSGSLFLARISLAVGLTVPLGSAVAGDEPLILTKIVERGDPADGLGENLLFADFGNHPQLEAILGPGGAPVRINKQGNVSFHAFATEDGGLGECPFIDITQCPPAGLFRVVNNRLQLIAAVGDEAPGTGQPFLGFPAFFPVTPHLSNGQAALLADIGEIPFDGQAGIWSDQSGALELLLLEGETMLPGMPQDGELTRPFFFKHEADAIFFVGELDTDQLPTDFHSQGLWRIIDGNFEPIGVAGTAAPGFPKGVVFGDSDNTNILGTFGTFDNDDAGRVAFHAFVRGPGIETRDDEAIWIETDRGFEIFLREDEPVPPGLFDPGSTFSNGNVLEGAFFNTASPPIRMNNNGDIVFYSEVDVPGDPPRVPTLWSNRNGKLELVMRGRQRGVAFSVPGDEAPGVPNGHFFFPNTIDIHDSGDIVLRAVVETNNDIFDSTMGIWVDRGDGFEPVAFEEGPVPEMPGVTFLPEIGNVRGVGRFVLESDGTIVYTGRFIDNGFLTVGVFRHPTDGPATLLFKTFGEVNIDGDDIRTILKFTLGQGSSEAGAKVVEVFFTDGSVGLYSYDFNPDTSIPGDLDGDGTVGVSDLLILLASWGPCADCEDCGADLDGNCIVGVSDLLILLGNWG